MKLFEVKDKLRTSLGLQWGKPINGFKHSLKIYIVHNQIDQWNQNNQKIVNDTDQTVLKILSFLTWILSKMWIYQKKMQSHEVQKPIIVDHGSYNY